MYTLRSHMSVVEFICAFHRPTTTKSSKSQVTTSSYHFNNFQVIRQNKVTHLETSTKYIHKSHMSAVVYTSTSHRPTHLHFKVLQNSYQVAKTANIDIFQSKLTCSSLKTYNSILINHISMSLGHFELSSISSKTSLSSYEKIQVHIFQNPTRKSSWIWLRHCTNFTSLI